MVDLTEGSVALDLLAFARSSDIDPLVWVLPEDLPRLDLGAGLSQHALADMLSLVASVSDDERSTRDLAIDNAISHAAELSDVNRLLADDPRLTKLCALL